MAGKARIQHSHMGVVAEAWDRYLQVWWVYGPASAGEVWQRLESELVPSTKKYGLVVPQGIDIGALQVPSWIATVSQETLPDDQHAALHWIWWHPHHLARRPPVFPAHSLWLVDTPVYPECAGAMREMAAKAWVVVDACRASWKTCSVDRVPSMPWWRWPTKYHARTRSWSAASVPPCALGGDHTASHTRVWIVSSDFEGVLVPWMLALHRAKQRFAARCDDVRTRSDPHPEQCVYWLVQSPDKEDASEVTALHWMDPVLDWSRLYACLSQANSLRTLVVYGETKVPCVVHLPWHVLGRVIDDPLWQWQQDPRVEDEDAVVQRLLSDALARKEWVLSGPSHFVQRGFARATVERVMEGTGWVWRDNVCVYRYAKSSPDKQVDLVENSVVENSVVENSIVEEPVEETVDEGTVPACLQPEWMYDAEVVRVFGLYFPEVTPAWMQLCARLHVLDTLSWKDKWAVLEASMHGNTLLGVKEYLVERCLEMEDEAGRWRLVCPLFDVQEVPHWVHWADETQRWVPCPYRWIERAKAQHHYHRAQSDLSWPKKYVLGCWKGTSVVAWENGEWRGEETVRIRPAGVGERWSRQKWHHWTELWHRHVSPASWWTWDQLCLHRMMTTPNAE